MSIQSLAYQVYLSAITVTSIFWSFSYKMAAKPAGIDTERNYVTATLCIVDLISSAFFLAPVGVAEYCDELFCLSVCLSVREHTSETTRPMFTKFTCVLPMVVARSSSVGVAMCYVLPVLWRHMDGVIFAYSGPQTATWRHIDTLQRVTSLGQHVYF